MDLIFATNNLHKIKEAKEILNKLNINILSLKDINFNIKLQENSNTIKENASQKARYVYEITKKNCFADDTALEVEALNNEPGVFSARYAGENANSQKNIEKLLNKLKNINNRKAKFRTIIALIINGKEYFFEGIVNGIISNKKKGSNGFGYDPVFMPSGYKKTFAEMKASEKNKISHRNIALIKLYDFLKSSKFI